MWGFSCLIFIVFCEMWYWNWIFFLVCWENSFRLGFLDSHTLNTLLSCQFSKGWLHKKWCENFIFHYLMKLSKVWIQFTWGFGSFFLGGWIQVMWFQFQGLQVFQGKILVYKTVSCHVTPKLNISEILPESFKKFYNKQLRHF